MTLKSYKILIKFIDIINAGKETRRLLQETQSATRAHNATTSGTSLPLFQNLKVFLGENDFLVKLAKDLRERVDESKESGTLSKVNICHSRHNIHSTGILALQWVLQITDSSSSRKMGQAREIWKFPCLPFLRSDAKKGIL